MTPNKRSGFTLFELAIVLTIVGLIIAGIFIGKELIHASEIRSVVSNVDAFKSQFSTFRLKFNGLPGDISNATSFLGNSVPNGDGDSKINYLLGAPGEEYDAWVHLAAAKMIAGDFDGTQTSLPKSRLAGGMYRVSYLSGVYSSSGNMISLNALNPTFNLAHDAILTPTDAFSIDAKTDDGLADRGKILGVNPQGVPGCATNYYTAGSGSYILTNNTILCKMFFLLDF